MVFFLDVFHFLMYIFLHGGAELAQSVEQGTENPRVRGSIPRLGTIFVSVSRASSGDLPKYLLWFIIAGVVSS